MARTKQTARKKKVAKNKSKDGTAGPKHQQQQQQQLLQQRNRTPKQQPASLQLSGDVLAIHGKLKHKHGRLIYLSVLPDPHASTSSPPVLSSSSVPPSSTSTSSSPSPSALSAPPAPSAPSSSTSTSSPPSPSALPAPSAPSAPASSAPSTSTSSSPSPSALSAPPAPSAPSSSASTSSSPSPSDLPAPSAPSAASSSSTTSTSSLPSSGLPTPSAPSAPSSSSSSTSTSSSPSPSALPAPSAPSTPSSSTSTSTPSSPSPSALPTPSAPSAPSAPASSSSTTSTSSSPPPSALPAPPAPAAPASSTSTSSSPSPSASPAPSTPAPSTSTPPASSSPSPTSSSPQIVRLLVDRANRTQWRMLITTLGLVDVGDRITIHGSPLPEGSVPNWARFALVPPMAPLPSASSPAPAPSSASSSSLPSSSPSSVSPPGALLEEAGRKAPWVVVSSLEIDTVNVRQFPQRLLTILSAVNRGQLTQAQAARILPSKEDIVAALTPFRLRWKFGQNPQTRDTKAQPTADSGSAAKKPKLSIRHAEKPRVATCTFANRVAQLVVDEYKARCPVVYRQTVVAGIVVARRRGTALQLRVASFGVGTKIPAVTDRHTDTDTTTPAAAMPGSGKTCQGDKEGRKRLRDCHAEVLARRGFQRFLHQQIALCAEQGEKGGRSADGNSDGIAKPADDDWTESILVRRGPKSYGVVEGVSFHLYTSSAPCGNSTIRRWAKGGGAALHPDLTHDIWPNQPHDRISIQAKANGQTALLAKGERNGPASSSKIFCVPGTTPADGSHGQVVTCSDKIAKWNVLGLQGSLLMQWLESPIYLSTCTIGRKFTLAHCRRALCCRMQDWGRPHKPKRRWKRHKRTKDGKREEEQERQKSESEPPSPPWKARFTLHHPCLLGTSVQLDDGVYKEEESASFEEPRCVVWTQGDKKAEVICGTSGLAIEELVEAKGSERQSTTTETGTTEGSVPSSAHESAQGSNPAQAPGGSTGGSLAAERSYSSSRVSSVCLWALHQRSLAMHCAASSSTPTSTLDDAGYSLAKAAFLTMFPNWPRQQAAGNRQPAASSEQPNNPLATTTATTLSGPLLAAPSSTTSLVAPAATSTALPVPPSTTSS